MQLEVVGPTGFDGQIDLFETYGPRVSTADPDDNVDADDNGDHLGGVTTNAVVS